MTNSTRKQRSNDDLVVAGAGAEGHGILTSFSSDGPLTRVRFCDALQRAGVEPAWFPAAKDPKAQATRAMRKVAAANGMRVECERKGRRQVAEARDWAGRWLIWSDAVGDDETRASGASVGSVIVAVTLYDDAAGMELAFDVEHAINSEIRAEFESLIGSEVYAASDITSHLNVLHRDLFGGVRYGGGAVWYVPRANRALAEALYESMWETERYGSWMNPPLPVATSAQLQAGIALGLCSEVDEQLALLANQRKRLREANGGFDATGKPVAGGAYNDKGEHIDIGARAAESFAVRFARVMHRVRDYAAQLGADLVRSCEVHIHDAMVEIDALLEGGSVDEAGKMRDLLAEQEAAEAERQAAIRAEAEREVSMADAPQSVRELLSSWWATAKTKGERVGTNASAMACAKYRKSDDSIAWRGERMTCRAIFAMVDA